MVLSSQFAESYKGMSQIFTITIKIFFSHRLEKNPKPLLVSTYKKYYLCGCFNPSILNFIIFYKDHHDSYVLNQSKQIYKPLQSLFDSLTPPNPSIPFHEMNNSVISDLRGVKCWEEGRVAGSGNLLASQTGKSAFQKFPLDFSQAIYLRYPPPPTPQIRGGQRREKILRFGMNYH